MNKLLNISEQKARLTMSSREIASLINKNHSDLCRSIERLMAKGVIKGDQPMAYTHPQNGQIYYEYHLEKRDCLIVVAQNCPEFTAVIVDRWQELENQQKPTALSRKELALMVLQAEEENERLQLENAQLKPKRDVLMGQMERVANDDRVRNEIMSGKYGEGFISNYNIAIGPFRNKSSQINVEEQIAQPLRALPVVEKTQMINALDEDAVKKATDDLYSRKLQDMSRKQIEKYGNNPYLKFMQSHYNR
ncbi:Rha family transcriptional regulator [Bisgaard Taxon 45]